MTLFEKIMAHCVQDPETGCLNCTIGINSDGYANVGYQGKKYKAHIAVFVEVHGYQPPVVCHACDNRKCCSPEHLFAGTQAINMADAKAKLRLRGKPKVSPEVVAEIRSTPVTYGSTNRLAKKHGLSHYAVVKILSRKSYAWLP